MTFTLTSSMFTNNVYSVTYGYKKATFTIVDEEYANLTNGAHISRMNCDIQTFNTVGELIDEVFGSLVIGLGDTNVAVTSSDASLLGQLLTASNMEDCVVELYE